MNAINLLQEAWDIIANASAGDWNREPLMWQEAAKKWRDKFRVYTAARQKTPAAWVPRPVKVIMATNDVFPWQRSRSFVATLNRLPVIPGDLISMTMVGEGVESTLLINPLSPAFVAIEEIP